MSVENAANDFINSQISLHVWTIKGILHRDSIFGISNTSAGFKGVSEHLSKSLQAMSCSEVFLPSSNQ